MISERQIVVSGTYSTGKTTTATALSLATGIPLVRALSAREILVDLYPGRRFQDMSAEELIALGLRRLDARIRSETELVAAGSGFISDGSVLNEWAYAAVRAKIGINPGAPLFQQFVKAIFTLPSSPFIRRYVAAYGAMARLHARESYSDVVHLPIEFEMDPDGHRPVSERYRRISDRDLYSEFTRLGFEPWEVSGSIPNRVDKVIDRLNLPRVRSSEEATEQALEEIQSSREAVARRILAQDPHLNTGQRARLVFRL